YVVRHGGPVAQGAGRPAPAAYGPVTRARASMVLARHYSVDRIEIRHAPRRWRHGVGVVVIRRDAPTPHDPALEERATPSAASREAGYVVEVVNGSRRAARKLNQLALVRDRAVGAWAFRQPPSTQTNDPHRLRDEVAVAAKSRTPAQHVRAAGASTSSLAVGGKLDDIVKCLDERGRVERVARRRAELAPRIEAPAPYAPIPPQARVVAADGEAPPFSEAQAGAWVRRVARAFGSCLRKGDLRCRARAPRRLGTASSADQDQDGESRRPRHASRTPFAAQGS